jgi:hypothetical protein
MSALWPEQARPQPATQFLRFERKPASRSGDLFRSLFHGFPYNEPTPPARHLLGYS